MAVEHRNFMTWALILIIVAIHAETQNNLYELSTLGALVPVYVWSGEIWRLVTAIFLHANWVHLGFNCLALYQIGRLFESLVGPARFLFVFLVSGIGGFCASLMINSSTSIGASGAVFGVLGALLGSLLMLPKDQTNPKLIRALLWVVAINLAIGLVFNWGLESAAVIDNAAHVGGLLTGFLFGVAFSIDIPWIKMLNQNQLEVRKKLANIVLVFSYVFLFSAIGAAIKPWFSTDYCIQMGQHDLNLHEKAKAEEMLSCLSQKKNTESYQHLLLGRMEMQSGHEEKARILLHRALRELSPDPNEAWEKALKTYSTILDPNGILFVDEKTNATLCEELIGHLDSRVNAGVLNDCAWLMLMANDKRVLNPKQALFWAREAVKRNGGRDPSILHTLAQAYVQTGNMDEALQTIHRAMGQSGSKGTLTFLENEKNRWMHSTLRKKDSKSKGD